jgi:DNA-binding NarL/FixJ family response regulator
MKPVHPVTGRQTSAAVDRSIVVPASNDPERSAVRAAGAPITVLVAWRTISDFDTELPKLCAPDIRWLEPRVVAPRLLLPALMQQRPDVLLLGQEIFDELDTEELAQLQTRFAGLHILLVAQAPAPELNDKVLRCHFRGVLPANCPPETCPNAVRAICQGEIWLPRALLSKLVARKLDTRVFGQTLLSNPPARATKASSVLSRREQEVVELVRQGLTNKEIARQLHIMEDTVKKHLQNVFAKLGVHRRTLVALNGCRPPDRRGRAAGAAIRFTVR